MFYFFFYFGRAKLASKRYYDFVACKFFFGYWLAFYFYCGAMLAFFYRCVLFFVNVKVSVWVRAVSNDAQDWVGLATSIKIPDMCLKSAIFPFANFNALYFIFAG